MRRKGGRVKLNMMPREQKLDDSNSKESKEGGVAHEISRQAVGFVRLSSQGGAAFPA